MEGVTEMERSIGEGKITTTGAIRGIQQYLLHTGNKRALARSIGRPLLRLQYFSELHDVELLLQNRSPTWTTQRSETANQRTRFAIKGAASYILPSYLKMKQHTSTERMILLITTVLIVHPARLQTIRQSPVAHSGSPGDNVTLNCTLSGSGTFYMFWYRQRAGEQLRNLFYSVSPGAVTAQEVVDGFVAERPEELLVLLKSSELQVSHSALVFCAWSTHGGADSSSFKVRFGSGFCSGYKRQLSTELVHCLKERFKTEMFVLLGLMIWAHQVSSQTITQTPAVLSRSPGENVTMTCTVKGTSADPRMFWYRQLPGKELENLFYSAATKSVNSDEPVDGFTAQRPDGKTFTLSSSHLEPKNSAVYFCAWSLHIDSEREGRLTKTC
ncbi:uncharacterized protein [Mobula birostris]|uniref:uncharacterized protein n=1 Tax=Mobula birostris TaxID=1983395 RepID=UPI003B285F4F